MHYMDDYRASELNLSSFARPILATSWDFTMSDLKTTVNIVPLVTTNTKP